MKFTVTFKTPDTLEDSIKEKMDNYADHCGGSLACRESSDKKYASCDDCEEQRNKLLTMKEEAEKLGNKFISYGEYVTIEFDTEEGTATVVPL